MKTLCITLLLLWSSLLLAQRYQPLISNALSLYKAGKYQESLEQYEAAFKIRQNLPRHLYNAACSAALAGNSDKSFDLLNLALQKKWVNLDMMQKDSDLISLHGNPAWEKLVADMQAAKAQMEASYNPELERELLDMQQRDQQYRGQIRDIRSKFGQDSKEMKDLWVLIHAGDSLNMLQLKKILDKHGWVGSDKVGAEANMAIFLIIQHADLPTQQQYLPMMREAVKDQRADIGSLAMLEDRVALGEGRRQIYGSQIGFDDATKTYYLSPLEDPDHVDDRRDTVGLGLIADYVKRWKIDWNVDVYKQQLPELEAKLKKN